MTKIASRYDEQVSSDFIRPMAKTLKMTLHQLAGALGYNSPSMIYHALKTGKVSIKVKEAVEKLVESGGISPIENRRSLVKASEPETPKTVMFHIQVDEDKSQLVATLLVSLGFPFEREE
jgi:hypothetical protein